MREVSAARVAAAMSDSTRPADERAKEAAMDAIRFDLEEIGGMTLDECDEPDYGCDDIRPALLTAELAGGGGCGETGFAALWLDR
jgi:hypothetical protein